MSTTLVLSLASVACALVAIFGSDDSFSSLTVAAALAGLVPWALAAGGVRVPVLAFAAMSLTCAAVILVVDGNEGGMFPVMLMVVWVGRSTSDWRIQAAVLAISGALLATTMRQESAHETGLVYFAGGLGISWLAGLMLRRQESLTVELQEMNELRVEHAAAAERARIAREVHDVVAHSLTVVMLNLTGARRAMAKNPARAEEALARAEAVGRDSIESIRQVMGLLREGGSGRDAPQPGLADLGALIDGYRTGGLPVDATVDDVNDLDPTAGLVVFRVVQESLTNALRHAPGAACSVVVRSRGTRAVEVEVVNGPPSLGQVAGVGAGRVSVERGGLGLRGMTERVRAVGGEVVAGPRPGGGWRVVATIPIRHIARRDDIPADDFGNQAEADRPQPVIGAGGTEQFLWCASSWLAGVRGAHADHGADARGRPSPT